MKSYVFRITEPFSNSEQFSLAKEKDIVISTMHSRTLITLTLCSLTGFVISFPIGELRTHLVGMYGSCKLIIRNYQVCFIFGISLNFFVLIRTVKYLSMYYTAYSTPIISPACYRYCSPRLRKHPLQKSEEDATNQAILLECRPPKLFTRLQSGPKVQKHRSCE